MIDKKFIETMDQIGEIRVLLQEALDKAMACHDGIGPRCHHILITNLTYALGNLSVWRDTYPEGDPEKLDYIAKLWEKEAK